MFESRVGCMGTVLIIRIARLAGLLNTESIWVGLQPASCTPSSLGL